MILPIRVKYEGELGYSLGAHLNRYQHVLWRGAGSNGTLLPQISRVWLGQSQCHRAKECIEPGRGGWSHAGDGTRAPG